MNSKLLREGLDQIKKSFGISTFHDGRRMVALFSDLVPEGRIERNALKHLYDSGAMKFLLSSVEDSANPDYAILKAIDALKNNVFMDERIASQLVDDICYVLGISVSKPQSTNVSPRVPSYNTTSNVSSQAPNKPKNPPTSTYTTSRRVKPRFPWARVFIISLILIAIGTIIGVSIYSWQIGQWIIGVILAFVIIVLTLVIYTSYYSYLPQVWINAGLSIVNIVLAWLFPVSYSTMAIPVAIGIVVALFVCAYYAYDDFEETVGMASVVIMACDLAVATSVRGGFSSILLWLVVYILPAFLISLIIAAIYEKCDGDNGVLISSIVAVVIIGFHVLLVCVCPHFVHSLHKYPELLEKDFGPKKAICYCEEEIEVGQFLGDMIHAYTCEHHNLWKPLENTTCKFDEQKHWFECPCGVVIGSFSGYYEHEMVNGACEVCGYEKVN